MKAYLDSSFVVSMYAPDAHSADVTAELAKFKGELLLSSLGELETVNALELRVFRKELGRREMDKAHAAFEGDIKRGAFAIFELDAAAFVRASQLVMQTTSSLGCRSADILHVAAALEVGADRIFTFDQRQRLLAGRVKLKTN